MERKISLILTLIMVAVLIVPSVVFGVDYSEHWAKDTIQEWFNSERIKGYDDGSFKPDNTITRAEFMTMVNSAYRFETLAEIKYDDANEGEWYYKEIQKAVKAGYIVGDNEETVRPKDEITRQEVAVVIARLNELKEKNEISVFSDKHKVAQWAANYVGAVYEGKFMIGDDNNNFNPTNPITRAEALVTLDRAMKDKFKHATISELSIEGAELEGIFEKNKTAYKAVAMADAKDFTIVADVSADVKVEFSSNAAGSKINVITASATKGYVYTAQGNLSNIEDTAITIKVTQEGLEDRIYIIIISEI